MRQILIFTDLDGTLIDHDTYDFKEAKPALDMVRQMGIPVIICSSKTRAEIQLYRLRMDLSGPFITENGGGIFIPANALNLTGVSFVDREQYHVVELGVTYAALCNTWREIRRKKGFLMTGFHEMTPEEIAAFAGLPLKEARLAANREYSEPFMFSDTLDQFHLLIRFLQEKGLRTTKGGRFYHVIGRNDKGKAVEILKKIYANTYPEKRIWTVGLGDSANDIPMLKHMDMAVMIRKKTGKWESVEGIDSIIYSEENGPRGWAESITALLKGPTSAPSTPVGKGRLPSGEV